MIVEEHVQAFINALNREEEEEILRLEREAHDNHVPIIRPETRQLLRFLVRLSTPERILEIGTAIGYSAMIMQRCGLPDLHIDTIERNRKRYEQACANIQNAGLSDRIQVHFGDAMEVLPTLTGSYQFIFMDAAKAQYAGFLHACLALLEPNGLLVCDNILQDGSIAQSRFAVARRDHTVHDRMREFLFDIKRDETLDTVILPVGDGVAVCRKEQ